MGKRNASKKSSSAQNTADVQMRDGIKDEDESQMRIVLPGDDVTSWVLPGGDGNGDENFRGESSDEEMEGVEGETSKKLESSKERKSNRPDIRLGRGLRQVVDDGRRRRIVCTCAGLLTEGVGRKDTWYVRPKKDRGRYLPSVGDRVIGVVEERMMGAAVQAYRMNIRGPHPAWLPLLAFEGATKRNRPNLAVGTIVYARVESVDSSSGRLVGRATDPRLSCMVGGDAAAARRDWMTDEGTYGELVGGTLLEVPLDQARDLLHPSCVVWECLGSAKLGFEVAIGVNGLVWIHSESPEITVLIRNAVLNSYVLSPRQVRAMVRELIKRVVPDRLSS